MMSLPLQLSYTASQGLCLSWTSPELTSDRLPVRVRIKGEHTFYVWGAIPSGEDAPAWAEADLDLTFFGPDNPVDVCGRQSVRVESLTENGVERGFRVTATHPRARVELDVRMTGVGEARFRMTVSNPQGLGGQRLPVCLAELSITGFDLGPDGRFTSAHAYGGRTHGSGTLAGLGQPGVPFVHGTIGLGLPLVYLHSGDDARGWQFEFMMDGRPTAWVKPGEGRGNKSAADFAIAWTTDRLLLPGQSHVHGGELGLKPYIGRAVQMMRDWRDQAGQRYGIAVPDQPEWVHHRSCIEIWLSPGTQAEDFSRMDDPRLYAMLKQWADWGYDAIMAVAPNPSGSGPLSPFHYGANLAMGGPAAEKIMLDWMHDLGFHVGIWFTTVGLDKAANPVRERRDWWTHRANLDLFYAWDAHESNGFVGYAPDGDPCSTGWRRFMLGQLDSLLERGYNGVFIDGCIPRASNHARWFWPGETRNSVEDQVVELAQRIRSSGHDAVLTNEDGGLGAQATCEITTGRYTPVVPYQKKAYWDHGMGGGPAQLGEPPRRITPEQVRDYLLIRYASLLPFAVSEDGIEGYCSEEARPWTVQTMLAGPTTFKTHCQFVNDPMTFRPLPDAPPAADSARDPEHRRKGHEEFLQLLRFRRDEPLVGNQTPLSIEGVLVEGDPAVVGFLRPTAGRCLLILMNFANQTTTVNVRLAAPIDVPAAQKSVADDPHKKTWKTHERLRSWVNDNPAGDGTISATEALTVQLGAYGFRLYELNL